MTIVEQQEKQINVSNNKFASGNSMNCGNVLTERPSSRVLHPPGGKSSITFG
jgi:SPIRAL1-like protein